MVKYNIGDALLKGIALLNESQIETAGLDARILMCHVLKCDKLYLTVHRDDVPDDYITESFFELIDRRCKNEPLGYIIGTKEFMSLDFCVNSNVLIPRPDTEILVERVIREINAPEPVIIDMCTGSGAIAVSLAKYIPKAEVTGLDISPGALEVAKHNAALNGVDVSFALHDVLKPYTGVTADAVVSNPPYIPTAELVELESNVIDYEPHLALDGGDDGLLFYRAIVSNISSCLKPGGLLAFEVGCGLADEVASLMEKDFKDITIEKDLAGIERVVYARYNASVSNRLFGG